MSEQARLQDVWFLAGAKMDGHSSVGTWGDAHLRAPSTPKYSSALPQRKQKDKSHYHDAK